MNNFRDSMAKLKRIALILLLAFTALYSTSSIVRAEKLSQSSECQPDHFKSISLDGVSIDICLPFQPEQSLAASTEDIVQSASFVNLQTHQMLSVYAVPYGIKPASDGLPDAQPGVVEEFQGIIKESLSKNASTIDNLFLISMFGQQVSGIAVSQSGSSTNDSASQKIISEWIVEAGDRVWIIGYIWDLSGQDTFSLSRLQEDIQSISLDSQNLSNPSISKALAQEVSPLITTLEPGNLKLAGDLPSPSWWNGDCDVNNFPGSYPLGGIYRGVKACGPRNTLHKVNFGAGVDQFEWQCAEYVKRYLYLAYGTPAFIGNGKDIVNNYPRSNLEKITDGTPNKGPYAGDVVSYAGPDTAYGHTALVYESNIDSNGNGYIKIAEENYSQTGMRTQNVSNWHIQSSDIPTGWLHDPSSSGGGGSSDTTAPSGGFNIPTEGLTVNYPTVAISGWGQDNSGGSGFDHAHFTAYYNGAWHLISGDFTSSPFSFDWNLCNAGVPDGQVTLGLDVWDKAGNAAYSPGGVRHFNKSYNCGSSSGGGTWNARYFEGSSGWWDPASLNNATPKCTESLNSLDKNYGSSAPCGNGMSGDNWVGDYSASINFPAGNYVFIADHDDNFKLWLGSTNIADRGGSGSNDKVCPARFLSGTYNVRAMLYENGGDARIKLTWSTDTSLCVQPPATPSLSSPGNNDTVGRYDTVTLNWNAVSDATNYNVEFWGGPNYSISQTVSSPSLTIGSTFWGGIYQWKVSAVNNAGPSGWSETRTLNRKYGAPTYLNTSNITQNQASLSWGASADAPGNISGYRIYRNGSAINTVSSSSTSYTDSTLSCGNTYNFAVTAYSGGLESDSSVTQTVTTPACGASTPQLISPDDTATFNEGEAITLSWTATGTQFYGEISGGPAGTSTFGWQPEASKYIGPQWAGYTYSWKVMAKNSGGQSGYSPTRTFTVLPGKPTNLSTTGSTCSRVNLNWSDNSGSEQGYKVYRDSSLIATLGSNVTSYQDASVSNDITYSYSVSAYRGSIFSPASDAISWTTACPPSNDHLANAAVISSLPFNTTQSTRGATIESSEPNYPVGWNNGSSVWYQFTPSITQAYAVDTFGSNYDTVLHVFERTSSGTLSLIQGDDDDTDLSVTQSKIIFTGVAGTTYFFSISQYNSTSGGSLTVNLSAVACPASSLCVTVTSPYYRASNLWISVRTDSGGYAGGVRADNYGYGVVSGITQGNYSVSVSGSHMLRFVNNISGPGNLNVSGVGLPSVQVSLKDINGTQLDSIAYLATNNGYYYVGYAYVNSPLELFATPGDYLLVQEGSTAKYLTYQDVTIQTGMNLTPVVYDVSQSPAQIFHYTVQNASYAELNLWHGNYGDTISLSNGDTAVISFPAHMSFYLEHLIRAESTTEYWYYQFASRTLRLNMLRQEENISLGGTFQNVVSAYNGPVGAGDTVGISYRVYDEFGHHLESLWTQAKSASVQAAGLGSPRQVIEDEPGVTHLYHPGDPQAEGGITLQGISDIFASIQILNPSSVQTYQETQNYWNGSTSWVIPSNPTIGDWTARVTLNNIGPYQGQTVGEQTFSVRNSTAPANDQFPNAQIVTSMPFNTSLDTYGATQDYDDPSIPKCNLKALAASVWYSFTPTINGTLRLDTIGSDYDTVLAVWTGARGSLSLVDCNDDRIISPRDQDSELTVPMVANRTYTILLGKYNGDLLAQSLGPQMASRKLTLNTAGAGTAQLHMSFSSSIPSTVQLISPDGDILLTRSPSFTWAPQPYTVWYTLRVFSGSGKIMFDRTLYAADVCSASLCQYTLHVALSNGNYTWRVLAGNTIGSSYWSSNKIFVVDSDIPFTIFIPFIRK